MMREKLKFFSKWRVQPIDEEGKIECSQKIEISSIAEEMHNHFTLFEIGKEAFKVTLESQSVGKVEGQGIIRPKLISWELRQGAEGVDGFEFFELDGEEYKHHAEYATGQDYRTVIDGKIWKKVLRDENTP